MPQDPVKSMEKTRALTIYGKTTERYRPPARDQREGLPLPRILFKDGFHALQLQCLNPEEVIRA
jgi:hypothetical protein